MKIAIKEILIRSVRIVSWGIAYYIVDRLSLKFFLTTDGVALAWPPIGIYISAILLTRPKDRPLVVMMVFLGDFLADLNTGVPYIGKLIYATLSMGDATLSAILLLRFAGDPFAFSKARNILLYVLLSVILCNGFFSIPVALVTHWFQGSVFSIGLLYSWVADGVGNLMVVPLIVSWSALSKNDIKKIRSKATLEVLVLILLLISLNILLFTYAKDKLLFSFIINYLSFPFIIWAIFRFDMKIVTTVLLLFGTVMIFNLLSNSAIFTTTSINSQIIFFQLYIASVAVITLLITAITAERNLAHKALVESEKNYRTVADYTYAWEYWIDSDNHIRYMSPAVEQITGYNTGAFQTDPSLLDEIVYSDDRYIWDQHKNAIIGHNSERLNKLEFRIKSKDGSIKWIGHDCRQIFINGTYIGLRVSNRDISSLVEAERKLLFNTVETEERERSRYSRELHDSLGPLLSTIKMYIQTLSETTEQNKIKTYSEEINNIIKIAIQTMREIAHGISPFNLNHTGYVNAMIEFIDRINRAHKLSINFEFNTKTRFNSFYEIILYRITTELINNTIRHAEATVIGISYNYDRERKSISLHYEDNGKGFDQSIIRNSEKGMGLANIRHRISMLRGNFQIESGEGKGVRIRIDFPASEKDTTLSRDAQGTLP